MEQFTKDELLEILPSSIRHGKELTKKQKMVLGQLMMYNGLNKSKDNGYCFRSNKDFCKDVGIETHTLLSALRKLEDMGFIVRRKGIRGIGASEYTLNVEGLYGKLKNKGADKPTDSTKAIEELTKRIRVLEGQVQFLMGIITPNDLENYTSEAESESEKEAELELELGYNSLKNKELNKNNKLSNNILNNNILLNNILEENCNKVKETEPLQSRAVKVETEDRGWINSLFLDPNDFEDNDSNEEGWD